MKDERLIKWFQFSDKELKFLLHALERFPDQRRQANLRMQQEIFEVLAMRAATPHE